MKVYILASHFTDIDVQTNVMGVFSTLDKAKDAGKDSVEAAEEAYDAEKWKRVDAGEWDYIIHDEDAGNPWSHSITEWDVDVKMWHDEKDR